jgi:hypothetical protein
MTDFDRDTIGGQSSGDTLLEEQVQFLEPGDHERFSHYVRREKIIESAVLGTPVVALCGKVWVPGRDPEKFPICPTCKEIYEGLRPEEPNSSDNGSGGGSGAGSGSN